MSLPSCLPFCYAYWYLFISTLTAWLRSPAIDLVDIGVQIAENPKVNVTFSCKKKVRAYKRFMIHRPPNVLTLQLKRYVGGASGYKLNRHLNFPLQLDLRPFVTEVNESSVTYKLYAVLVHYGTTTTSGHYYCFVLAPSGHWYKMNDAMVCYSVFCGCYVISHYVP